MAWPKPMSIVEIEWMDSMGMNGWHHADALDKFRDNPEAQCRSVGYLAERTPKGVVIVQGQAEGGARNEATFIPKSAIRKVRVLEKAPRRNTVGGR